MDFLKDILYAPKFWMESMLGLHEPPEPPSLLVSANKIYKCLIILLKTPSSVAFYTISCLAALTLLKQWKEYVCRQPVEELAFPERPSGVPEVTRAMDAYQ